MTLAAIEESRQRGGTLTLDTEDFAKQATDVSLVPTVNSSGDAVETLSGAKLAADETVDWTLNLGFIQDFNDPAGLVLFLRARAGEEVDFTWEPNEDGPSFSGTLKVRPTAIGGTVNARLTGTIDLPVVDHDMVAPV